MLVTPFGHWPACGMSVIVCQHGASRLVSKSAFQPVSYMVRAEVLVRLGEWLRRSYSSRVLSGHETSYRQIPGIVGKVGPGESIAPGEEPSPLLGEGTRLPCGLFEAGPQLVQERRSLA